MQDYQASLGQVVLSLGPDSFGFLIFVFLGCLGIQADEFQI